MIDMKNPNNIDAVDFANRHLKAAKVAQDVAEAAGNIKKITYVR